MEQEYNAKEREAPYSHIFQGLSPVIFIAVSIFDGMVFQWTTQLNSLIPFSIRFVFFSIFLVISIILITLSHKAIFHGDKASDKLITDGILKYMRNPMYLGIMCIYIAFISLSISLLSIGVFVIIFLIYNKMVKYEEKILEELFGKEFLEYKNHVPRWLPKFKGSNT